MLVRRESSDARVNVRKFPFPELALISPFALNNLVDVSGIRPGARVRDPVSEEIFSQTVRVT